MEQKIKLLYVDDEYINLELFKINMEKKYQVIIAVNGNEGLQMLYENPDTTLVISDMKMPGMNGIEFIEKARETYPEKKYFILTGFEITDEIRNALNKGHIIKYFRKPFNMKEINSALEMATNA